MWATTQLLHVAAARAGADAGLGAGEAAIIAAGIAGAVALLTSLLNFCIQRALAQRTEATAARAAKADRITEQLSKLYGPLQLLIAQSSALSDKLREGKPDPESWHLLDNLATVIADPADRAIANQIIEVNAEVEKLVLTHAGLLKDGEIPLSFVKFLGHYRFLTIAFRAAATPRGFTAKQYEYFPSDFDTDVASAYDDLRQERKQLLET